MSPQLHFLQWFLLGINAAAAVGLLARLIQGRYPRTQETTIGDDAIKLTISILMVVWVVTTL